MTVAALARLEFRQLKPVEGLVGPKDLTDEIYREYDFGDRIYRISDPVGLYFREGGGTHRIVDADGVTHCVTYGKYHNNVVLRWVSKSQPVSF